MKTFLEESGLKDSSRLGSLRSLLKKLGGSVARHPSNTEHGVTHLALVPPYKNQSNVLYPIGAFGILKFLFHI